MSGPLTLVVAPSSQLTADQRRDCIALCSRAFGNNYEITYRAFVDPTHVLAYLENTLVSQALWVTRWLQTSTSPLLRTAFVEAVATEPSLQGCGFASTVMRRLQAAVGGYDLAALSSGVPGFYSRLGWVLWNGPLFIRTNGDLLATPENTLMILRLPRTPSLDLREPLSAEWREGERW